MGKTDSSVPLSRQSTISQLCASVCAAHVYGTAQALDRWELDINKLANFNWVQINKSGGVGDKPQYVFWKGSHSCNVTISN